VPVFEKSITIQAPVAEVFEYLDDPVHLPEIWPSLYEVKDVQRLPNEGRKFTWFYNLAGKKVEGKAETIERVVHEKIVDKTIGGIDSVFTWEFMGHNGTTMVKLHADYKTPLPAVEPKLEPFLLRRNEFEADVLLENLKARFEF
jgi:uncharacterized membrane protein